MSWDTFWLQSCARIQVNEFSVGMGPALWHKVYHGTQYSLRALPVGGFVALEGEESPESQQAGQETDLEPQIPPEQRTGLPLNQAPIWQRMIVMSAGAVMNFVLGFVVLAVLIRGPERTHYQPGRLRNRAGGAVRPDWSGPPGRVLEVNGRRCFVANDILYELVRTESNQADFTVRRDGELVELPGVQFDTWQDEQGQTHMDIGFTVYGIERTPLNVLKEAGRSVLYYGRVIFTSLTDLLRGRESINDLSGPVGIVSAFGQAVRYGWRDLLELVALITINLGIFNLLPFPALDGGKVVFLLIEAVIGRPVPERIQGALTIAAFALLFGLMLFATYNDIIRLLSGAL